MSIRGRWHVVETPGYDLAVAGAYIQFDEDGGEFAIDCLTGAIQGACDGDGNCSPPELALNFPVARVAGI